MTHAEYKELLRQDGLRYSVTPTLKDWLVRNESWYIFNLLKQVRKQEYYSSRGGVYRLAELYHFWRYKRLSFKLKISLFPGTFEGGMRIYHMGGPTIVNRNCQIGKNCTIVCGVIFGNKNTSEDSQKIVVGDNCYFGAGAKVIGFVRIGNNVTVGANAVVTKDIPDNAVVGGVPARIIKIKEIGNKK